VHSVHSHNQFVKFIVGISFNSASDLEGYPSACKSPFSKHNAKYKYFYNKFVTLKITEASFHESLSHSGPLRFTEQCNVAKHRTAIQSHWLQQADCILYLLFTKVYVVNLLWKCSLLLTEAWFEKSSSEVLPGSRRGGWMEKKRETETARKKLKDSKSGRGLEMNVYESGSKKSFLLLLW